MKEINGVMAATRDPDRTRERIVAAATAEFSERGPAGARVDAIAQRAGVNKRMLYHYFGGKDDLFTEILRRTIEKRSARYEEAPEGLGDFLAHTYVRAAAEDTDWMRLITWEALALESGEPIRQEERRRDAIASYVRRWQLRQGDGGVPEDLDPVYLQLMITALTTYPQVFRQIVRLTTGRSPEDPDFQAGWADFLRQLGRRLQALAAAQPS